MVSKSQEGIYFLNNYPLMIDSHSLQELKQLASKLNPDVDGFDLIGNEFYSSVNSILYANEYRKIILYVDVESNTVKLKFLKKNIKLASVLNQMDIKLGALFSISKENYSEPSLIQVINKFNLDVDMFIDSQYEYEELHITLTDIYDTITVPYYVDLYKLNTK